MRIGKYPTTLEKKYLQFSLLADDGVDVVSFGAGLKMSKADLRLVGIKLVLVCQ